ncbi:MAG: tetratricopeptide repeat protein [Chthoniobacterales bacterium]
MKGDRSMQQKCLGIVAAFALILPTLLAEDAKFAADNLKYSRDFYSKIHFVAIVKLPVSFKYDRYPSEGPERLQCDDGTYTRQHGKPWVHSNDKMRTGLPIDYPERNRYAMTLALREDWGRSGEPVDKETARKLDGWIKMIEAALNVPSVDAKFLEKSETTDGRVQWIFEALSEAPTGAPTRLTFRKPTSDKSESVLLHEFSGSMRLEGDRVVAAGAANLVTLGFGYMMSAQQGSEVSEFVWEQMQSAEKSPGAAKASPTPAGPIQGSSHEPAAAAIAAFNRGKAKAEKGDLDGAIADYDRAIQLNPKDAAIYNNRGLAKQEKGDLDAAIVDFNRALQLNPKDAVACSNRGNAKRDKGDLDGAILDYNRAIGFDPKYAYSYYDRGLAKKQKSDLDGAIADYNRVIELDRDSQKPTATAAWPGEERAILMEPSATMIAPSSSIRNMPLPT